MKEKAKNIVSNWKIILPSIFRSHRGQVFNL